MASSNLQNVVITGANRGIGLEMCRQLLLEERYGTIFALCRKTTDALTELANNNNNNKTKLIIVEGLDLLNENAFDGGAAVMEALATHSDHPTPVHLLIHNAGAFGPPEQDLTTVPELVASQNLQNITPQRMMYAFQLNTMAPLFMTKAVLPNLKAAVEDSVQSVVIKVVIITSLMGSISDNTSGGMFAYRTSKAAVNMVGKSLSVDLPKLLLPANNGNDSTTKQAQEEQPQVAVGLVHPGAVFTDFVPNEQPMPGQRPVDVSVQGVLQAIHNNVTVENTGKFWHANYGEGVKPCDW